MANLSVEEMEDLLALDQPLLSVSESEGKFLIVGAFVVSDGIDDRGPIDQFNIGVVVDPSYPDIEPLVFEFGDRIPHDIDRHMYNSSACCITVFAAWRAKAKDKSLKAYFQGPIRNFFLSQLGYEETNDWLLGEYEHGAEGIAQACSDVLEFEMDALSAKRYMHYLSKFSPKGHWSCPCGSGHIVRCCCGLDKLAALRLKCSVSDAQQMLAKLNV